MKLFGFLLGIMVCDLFVMALIIVVECIVDVFRNRKNSSISVKCGTAARADYDMPRKAQCNCYHTLHSSAKEHDTAARMAQEAHDTAVRDSWAMHEEACYMAQQAHDTAVYDHQAAVDCHDQYVTAPDFGCSNPFS